MRAIVSLLVAVALLALSSIAAAAPRGALSVRPASGAAPLALARHGAAFEGTLVVENVGDGPLVVSRVTLRADDDDPRSPPGLAVIQDALPVMLAPHASHTVKVEWKPSGRARQLFGHVVVTSSDEERGEAALGVVADGRGSLGAHVLALLVIVPLLGAVAALAAKRLRRDDPAAPARVGAGFTLAQAAFAGVVFASFDPAMGRADGNDGLQLVERAAWVRSLGAEWFLGLDGSSAAAVCVLAVVVAVCLVALGARGDVPGGVVAALLVASSGLTGVLLARDLLLFSAALGLGYGGLVAALALSGPKATGAALRAGLTFALGFVCWAGAVAILHGASTPAFMLDGARASHHFSMAEIERTAMVGKTVAGLPANKTAFVLSAVALFALGGAFPFHGWLGRAAKDVGGPVFALACALGPRVAVVALLRVNYILLPEAARWAEGPLVALGAVSVAYAALLAVAERDWRRVLAHAATAQTGLAFASLATATAEGCAGAVALVPAQMAAIAAAALAVDAVEARTGTADLAGLGGLARASKGLAAIVVLAHAAIAGLPGLAVFWGEIVAATALARAHFVQLVIAGAGAVVLAGAIVWTLARALLGALPREVAAFSADDDGELPRLEGPELLALLPITLLLLVACAYPQPLLASAANAARLLPLGQP